MQQNIAKYIGKSSKVALKQTRVSTTLKIVLQGTPQQVTPQLKKITTSLTDN